MVDKDKEKIEKEKPEDMDETTFKKHINDGIYETIRKLHDSSEKVVSLSNSILELKLEIEKLKDEKIKLESKNDITSNLLNQMLPSTNNIYTPQTESA